MSRIIFQLDCTTSSVSAHKMSCGKTLAGLGRACASIARITLFFPMHIVMISQLLLSPVFSFGVLDFQLPTNTNDLTAEIWETGRLSLLMTVVV